jgi:hypothetical protein
MKEELNEDCGCGSTTDNIRSYTGSSTPKYSQDPLVGKKVSLVDGRSGMVDDSIRNNTGEVIGYVIEGDRGSYRVFKNKISGLLSESGGAFASLPSTPGMGNVVPPTPEKEGSGDQFPSLSVGTPAAKGKKKKRMTDFAGTTGSVEKTTTARTPNPLDMSLMDFKTFVTNSKKNQPK